MMQYMNTYNPELLPPIPTVMSTEQSKDFPSILVIELEKEFENSVNQSVHDDTE